MGKKNYFSPVNPGEGDALTKGVYMKLAIYSLKSYLNFKKFKFKTFEVIPEIIFLSH
jgi:hypothetical protein